MKKKPVMFVGEKENFLHALPKQKILFDEFGSISRNPDTTWSLELIRDDQSDNVIVRLWVSLNEGDEGDMFHLDLRDHPITPGLLESILEYEATPAVRLAEIMSWSRPELDRKRLEACASVLMGVVTVKVVFTDGTSATFANEDSFELYVGAESAVWAGGASTTLGALKPYIKVHPNPIQ